MRSKLRFPAAVALAAILAALACNTQTMSESPTLTPLAVVITATYTPQSQPARTVTVRPEIAIPTFTPTQLVPTLPPLPTSTPCINDSEFVADVTIPDDTPIARGRTFTKTWRVRNSGTCAWDDLYKFVLVDMEAGLNTDDDAQFMPPVAPGQNVDIDVAIQVTQAASVGEKLRATFQVSAPDGSLFGTQPYVQITVAPAEGQPGSATISGLLWADYCSVTAGAGNCVDGGTDGQVADGTRQNSESGIEGVLVELHQTTCSGTVIQQSLTASDGTFAFSRLHGGVYCVVINPQRSGNAELLIPGGWTYPAGDTGTQIVTISDGEIKPGVNFGWDAQFD